MEDNLYKIAVAELIKEVAEMENLQKDYAEKKCEPLILEVCDNMINHVKRAITRGLYPNAIKKVKDMMGIMKNEMAEEIVYELLIKENQI